MATVEETGIELPATPGDGGPRQKAMTIGAVCKALTQEFPDISISKIRYLEDQKLLAPRRTAGGYRLYSPGDVARLRTILRLQRDEFLPLRVIRQELASGRAAEAEVPGAQVDPRRARRSSVSVRDAGAGSSSSCSGRKRGGGASSTTRGRGMRVNRSSPPQSAMRCSSLCWSNRADAKSSRLAFCGMTAVRPLPCACGVS